MVCRFSAAGAKTSLRGAGATRARRRTAGQGVGWRRGRRRPEGNWRPVASRCPSMRRGRSSIVAPRGERHGSGTGISGLTCGICAGGGLDHECLGGGKVGVGALWHRVHSDRVAAVQQELGDSRHIRTRARTDDIEEIRSEVDLGAAQDVRRESSTAPATHTLTRTRRPDRSRRPRRTPPATRPVRLASDRRQASSVALAASLLPGALARPAADLPSRNANGTRRS